jgi:fatty acid synthase subunit alpha, fungi type
MNILKLRDHDWYRNFRDKAGRSIPAPGRGALTVAREVPTNNPPLLLDVAYRSRQLSFRRRQISDWLMHEHSELRAEMITLKSQDQEHGEYFASRVSDIENEANRQEKDALAMYGMLEGTDPRVSPLRRALAIWGLTADDIGVLSIHGTSTGANVSPCILASWPRYWTRLQEENETRIWNTILTSISRTPGNAVPIMAQKSLLGHSKGGSAAWQMMGLLQTINSGIIPGNRNSEWVDLV